MCSFEYTQHALLQRHDEHTALIEFGASCFEYHPGDELFTRSQQPTHSTTNSPVETKCSTPDPNTLTYGRRQEENVLHDATEFGCTFTLRHGAHL